MEVWRAVRWRQSVAARRAQSPGRIAISSLNSFSLVTFAGLVFILLTASFEPHRLV